jgi:hypothetical protein
MVMIGNREPSARAALVTWVLCLSCASGNPTREQAARPPREGPGHHGTDNAAEAANEALCTEPASSQEDPWLRYGQVFPVMTGGAVFHLRAEQTDIADHVRHVASELGVKGTGIVECEHGPTLLWIPGLVEEPSARAGLEKLLTQGTDIQVIRSERFPARQGTARLLERLEMIAVQIRAHCRLGTDSDEAFHQCVGQAVEDVGSKLKGAVLNESSYSIGGAK